MNALGLLRTLGPVDLRNVRRDPLLAWALVLPLVVALVLRWAVPALAAWLHARFGFDLIPYYPLFASAYVLVAPAFVGFIGGFLLLDERDDHVLDALRATPVSMNSLLGYRLGVPLATGLLVTVLGYPLLGLVALPVSALLAAAVLGAFSGPILALFLGGFAENKVSGFALMKLFGAISDLPLVAWFVPMPWQLAAGLLPSYWPMKVVWQAAEGAPWLGYALAGLAVNGLVVGLLLRRFRLVLIR
jgi:fluoroquinolone transport system permease protein